MKKICYDCEHRVIEPEDSAEVLDDPCQWQCRQRYWQDASICFKCHPEIRNWANRCPYFEMRYSE